MRPFPGPWPLPPPLQFDDESSLNDSLDDLFDSFDGDGSGSNTLYGHPSPLITLSLTHTHKHTHTNTHTHTPPPRRRPLLLPHRFISGVFESVSSGQGNYSIRSTHPAYRMNAECGLLWTGSLFLSQHNVDRIFDRIFVVDRQAERGGLG